MSGSFRPVIFVVRFPGWLEGFYRLFVLLRFWGVKIGVTADIRKAFQIIEVNESDRDFLRFLW